MKNLGILILAIFFACGLAGCKPAGQKTESASPAESAQFDKWLGKWTGPEGTFLDISHESDVYRVTIQSLDGPQTYIAHPDVNGLAFTRNGKTEIIHPGTGADTGMKWLADKHDCLVVKTGEGFCRD